MNTHFKNMTLATTILLAACKGEPTARTVKTAAKKIPAKEITADLIKMRSGNPFAVLQTSLAQLRKLEVTKAKDIIKMPKPRKNMDISKTKFKGNPKFLDIFLNGVLKGKGKQFYKAQEKYGVNATFLIGIANLESARGTSAVAKAKNNIAGMRTSKGYLNYKSVDDCIDSLAANIKNNYIDEGYTTIKKINKKYSENEEWGEHVVDCMDNIYNSSKSLLFQFE